MNTINVIQPYKVNGIWVFDDESVGLKREPFVSGTDDIIELLVNDIPDAENGFNLLFSSEKFPGSQIEFEWRRKEHGGNWYYFKPYAMEGWLCPALFKYFGEAPKRIYIQIKSK